MLTQTDIFDRSATHQSTHLGEVILLASGSMIIRPARGVQLRCSDFAQIEKLPTGELRINPLPDEISPEEAAEILGVSRVTLMRLLETYDHHGHPLIESRTPSPGRCLVATQSVFSHRERTRDREFWQH